VTPASTGTQGLGAEAGFMVLPSLRDAGVGFFLPAPSWCHGDVEHSQCTVVSCAEQDGNEHSKLNLPTLAINQPKI